MIIHHFNHLLNIRKQHQSSITYLYVYILIQNSIISRLTKQIRIKETTLLISPPLTKNESSCDKVNFLSFVCISLAPKAFKSLTNLIFLVSFAKCLAKCIWTLFIFIEINDTQVCISHDTSVCSVCSITQ